MKTKIKRVMSVVYTVIAFAVLLGGFIFIGIHSVERSAAYAADIESGQETDTSIEEEDSFSTVFKNDILPYIVSAGSGILAVLVVLIPYIKLRGKNNSLQGICTVLSKSLNAYKEKADEFTVENFLTALKDDVIEGLKGFIKETVENTVKDNFVDNTDGLNALRSTTDIICAQITNLAKAAGIAWKEAPGATELLAKSPTSEVLRNLYGQVEDLKKKVEAKQATELAEVDGVAKELEVYNVNE